MKGPFIGYKKSGHAFLSFSSQFTHLMDRQTDGGTFHSWLRPLCIDAAHSLQRTLPKCHCAAK